MIEGPFKQNNVEDLAKLQKFRYENLFNVYLKDEHYVYNILSKVNITNPVFFPEPGTKLKILKPEIASTILQQL